jgi:hypothetical protein
MAVKAEVVQAEPDAPYGKNDDSRTATGRSHNIPRDAIVDVEGGEARTKSSVIAKWTELQYKNVMELISVYMAGLYERGGGAFEA